MRRPNLSRMRKANMPGLLATAPQRWALGLPYGTHPDEWVFHANAICPTPAPTEESP